MLQPLVRRTWAPRGKTPVHRSWDRHDRLSIISAITISPRSHRLQLHFRVHYDNIRHPEAEAFLRQLRRTTGRRLLVVWDRLNVHRTAASHLSEQASYAFEWLPGYAPDLNPVEMVWNRTKYVELANFIPDDLSDLHFAAAFRLGLMRDEQALLGSFFQHAKLFL